MAKRSFYVKDSELDDYQVKVINKKTDNSYIVKGCAGSGKSKRCISGYPVRRARSKKDISE